MRRLSLILSLIILVGMCAGSVAQTPSPAPVTVRTVDGATKVYGVYELQVSNGTLTAVSAGKARITNAPAGSYAVISGTPANHYWPYWVSATEIASKSITASKPICSDSSGDPVVCAGTEGVWQVAGSYQADIGITGKTDSTSTTSSTVVASATAVKSAYDLANGKQAALSCPEGYPVIGDSGTSVKCGTATIQTWPSTASKIIWNSSGSVPTTTGISQTANYVYSGPTTGAAAEPAFRALVDADIPAGITRTIASGAVTSDQGSIGSGACSSAIDGGTATGTLTTDVISWNFNGDPTGITGFAASATGGLFIYAYPTADHVNFKICNNTAGAIDPGSITLNWKVIR